MKVSKEMALFFYDQCAGTTNGHMASIPNSPVLFGVLKAHTGSKGDGYEAATLAEFADFLELTVKSLREE